MHSRNLVLAVTACLLLALLGPAAAEPNRRTRQNERDGIKQRLKPSLWSNRIANEKGANGKISQTRQLRRVQMDKGGNGLLFRDTRNRGEVSRLINRSNTSLLRQQVFFAARPPQSRLGEKGILLHQNPVRGRLGQKGWVVYMPFRSSSKPAAVAPVGNIAGVRSALHQHLADNSVGALLIQKDPATGVTYRLQHAAPPVTKQLAADKVAVRCSFYGQTGPNTAYVPVSVEYRLTGNGQRWAVQEMQFVKVNGDVRPGAISEAELFENETALDEKDFPVKEI